MKKSIIIVAIAALALVSCHQPTEIQNVIEALSEMADAWSFLE